MSKILVLKIHDEDRFDYIEEEILTLLENSKVSFDFLSD